MAVRGKASEGLVYIVWAPFVETMRATIHLTVYAKRETAERIAKSIGGIVITRRVHPYYEADEDSCDDS